jgi:hypothetical protein
METNLSYMAWPKGIKSRKCPKTQAHFHMCDNVHESESQHSQMDSHFGSLGVF